MTRWIFDLALQLPIMSKFLLTEHSLRREKKQKVMIGTIPLTKYHFDVVPSEFHMMNHSKLSIRRFRTAVPNKFVGWIHEEFSKLDLKMKDSENFTQNRCQVHPHHAWTAQGGKTHQNKLQRAL